MKNSLYGTERFEQIKESLENELSYVVKTGVMHDITGDMPRELVYNDFLLNLDNLEKCIRDIKETVIFLKSHTCEYDNNHYCIHCGRDGRA